MDSRSQGFVAKIAKYLPNAEIICLALLMLGIVVAMSTDDITIVVIPVTGLALIYFLNAYAFPASVNGEGKPRFVDLLAKRIVPNVLWIGCAVVTVGLLYFILAYSPQSYKKILVIGLTAICGGFVTLGVLFASGVRDINSAVLYRAVPLALIGGYILWQM
jgi:hypothetical protein